MMNVFAAAKSDLALRIRRVLSGGSCRVGTPSRLVAALLVCGLSAVAFPSAAVAGNDDGIDWDTVKATAPEDWSDALRAQLLAAGRDLERLAQRVRKGQQNAIWREAMATDPEDWSEELKAKLLAAKPGSTLERIAEGVRQRRAWQTAMGTPPEEWTEGLKAQLLEMKPGSTIEEITEGVLKRQQAMKTRDGIGRRLQEYGRRIRAAVAAGEMTAEEGRQKMAAVRRRLGAKRGKALDMEAVGRRLRAAVESGKITPEEARKKYEELRRKAASVRAGDRKDDGVDWRAAMATDPAGWSDELKAQIVAAGYDLDEMAEKIRQRQEKAGTRGSHEGYALDSIAPNPFNPQTTIHYALPVASDVEIAIYNLTGQKVRTLLARQMAAGFHQLVWDGRDDSGRQLASGTYLVDMKADQFHETQKVTLAK